MPRSLPSPARRHAPPRLRLLWVLCGLIGAVGPATAGEFKLVLEPEPGTSVPARVCLASRAESMRAVQVPGIEPLAARARCDAAGTCIVDRGPRPAGCEVCDAARMHPECRAQVVSGQFPLSEYTVVCADDRTQPAGGGTVYIAVEPVEAENPPEFYGLEVSGGRVRWSPVNALSRPSYRVIGGDFAVSGLAYPRGESTPEWVSVPMQRRCRCVATRQPSGGAAIESVEVDGASSCHGAPEVDGSLQLEVPATRSGAVRAARIRTADSEAAIRWTTRWPAPDQRAQLLAVGFELDRNCTRPSLTTCPAVSTPRTICDRPTPIGGVCRYSCTTEPTAAVDLPLTLQLRLDAPEVVWQATLRAPGQRLFGGVPADRRALTVNVPSFPLDAAGQAIWAVEFDRGDMRSRLVLDGARRLHMPSPGLACGTPVVATYVGARNFSPMPLRVGPGVTLDLAHPEAYARSTSMSASIGMSSGGKGAIQDLYFPVASNTVFAVHGSVEISTRNFASPWAASVRAGVDFVPNWLMVSGGRGPSGAQVIGSRDAPFIGVAVQLSGHYTWRALDGVFEGYAGGGVGGGYPIGGEFGTGELVERILASAGVRRFLGIRGERWWLFGEVRGQLFFGEPPIALLDSEPGETGAGSLLSPPAEQAITGLEKGETVHTWSVTGGVGIGYSF